MVNIHIVTDSCAHFGDPHFIHEQLLTVVPNKLTIGGKSYRENIDLSPEEALHLIGKQSQPVTITAPTTSEYAEIYSRLARDYEVILSLHASREIFSSWQNAHLAAQQMIGGCEVIVIDSRSLCAAQGMLVKTAVQVAQEALPVETMVNTVRSAIDRLYAIYFVESMDTLQHHEIIAPSHVILGAMLGVKPFLTIEEGQLKPIEKVRTRAQAVERLVEFAVEFIEIEDALILQNRATITEQTRTLQERLAVEFPNYTFPFSVYGASMGSLIGAEASGIVILEREMEKVDDDYDDI